ncbi:OmpA family protein [Millisia brevis]|uniref:OmpA family protein n=1 Tax=Millisia brevis TaxID=264148 RepID=UPI001470A579|nr:hypothetical protein [Millisia brevis]
MTDEAEQFSRDAGPTAEEYPADFGVAGLEETEPEFESEPAYGETFDGQENLDESDWGTAASGFEEAGPSYEQSYRHADWPREIPDVAGTTLPGTIVVADYPRYATKVTDLRPDQVTEIRAVANAIVGALLAHHHISVVVEGFADFDTKGRDFEQQVSIDRAISARNFLVDEVHRRALATGLPAAALKRFSVQSAAFGTRRPSVRNPRNEDDRRQNRRIHIVWVSTPLPPERQQTFDHILDRANRALARVARPGPKRRLTCLIGKLQASRTADGYFSYDALRAFPGSAGWPAMSTAQFDLMVKATTVHARPQIRSIAAASRTPDELARALEQLDDTIGRNIFNFEQQLVGDSSTGVLMRTFNATIGRLQLDPQSILSCYSGYARIRHEQ